MKKAIITDFEEDILEFFKINKKFTIYTKNNYIFEKYNNHEHLECIHIESLLNNNEFNLYTKKTYKFIEKLLNIVVSKNIIEEKVIRIFQRTIINSYFSLFHHYILICKVISNNKKENIYVYNTNFPHLNKNLSIEFERYDNLYAYLSKNIFHNKINFVNKKKILKKSKRNKYSFLNIYLKILNILSLDFKSLKGKIKKKIRLNTKNNSKMFIYGDNDIFPYLFNLKNNKFFHLDKLNFKCNSPKQVRNFFTNNDRSKIMEYFEREFDYSFFKYNKIFINNFLNRINFLITIYLFNKKKLNRYIKNYIIQNKINGKVYTNGFFREIEKFFFYELKNHNITVLSFEHGITYGISDFSKYYKKFYSLIYSDIKILRSNLSKNIPKLEKYKSSEIMLGSPPYLYINFFYKLFNKFFSKIILGLNPFKKYILLSIPADNNNFIYGPNRLYDYENYKITKFVVNYLSSNYPKYKILIKKYNFERYLDNGFLEIMFKNKKDITIRRNPDNKFFLNACEVSYSTVYTSTLETMHNDKFNTFYISFNQNKLINNFENKAIKVNFKNKSFKKIPLKKLNFKNNWSVKTMSSI